MKARTRFAPSPTGYMHIGNLRTALYEYLIAKSSGGDFLLRIEDTDQKRYVEGATDIIYSTLKTVGMNWDEGPDIGGNYGPYIQSERKPIYAEYAHKLVELGGAHYCFCAPKDEAEDDEAEENAVSCDFFRIRASGCRWKRHGQELPPASPIPSARRSTKRANRTSMTKFTAILKLTMMIWTRACC